MTTIRTVSVAAMLLALGVCAAPPSSAQQIVLRAGPTILTGPSGAHGESGQMGANVHAGARLWLSNIFQSQLTVGYDELFTTEATLIVRPLGRGHTIEPYAYLGIGYQFGGEMERAAVPAGIGAEYALSASTGLFLEIGGRWHHRRDPAEKIHDLDFNLAPTIGAVYRFGQRPPAPLHATRADWRGRQVEQIAEKAASEDDGRRAGPEVMASADEPQPRATSLWADVPGMRAMSAPLEDDGRRIRVADGTFIMGLVDEDPLRLQHGGLRRVTVSGFYVDKMEVSNGAYKEVIAGMDPGQRATMMPDAGAWQRARSVSSFASYFESKTFDNYPVVAVTWDQARRYCAELGGRLPTEAEWEYVARSGMPGGIYPWPGFETRAPDGTYLANYNPGRGLYAADGYAFTAPVDAFLQTAWGMYNVAGNVSEWVSDAYSPSLASLSDFNPHHDEVTDGRRVIRGGSWASDEFFIGVGVRDAQQQDEATIYTGFRCAYDIGHEQPARSQAARESDEPFASPRIAGEPVRRSASSDQ